MKDTPRTVLGSDALINVMLGSRDFAVWSYDKLTKRTTVSPGLEALYGYSQDDFDRNPDIWNDIVVSSDQPHERESVQMLNRGIPCTFEYEIVDAFGARKWLQCMAAPIRDKDGNVTCIYGIELDITVKKTSKEMLEKEKMLVRNMLNAVNVAVWSYDNLNDRMEYVNDAICIITGYPLHLFSSIKFWKSLIHPDDLPIFENTIQNVLQGAGDECEYRISHEDGRTLWLQFKVMPITDHSGRITRIDGLVMDITNRKTMQEALHQSEQRYKSLFDYHSDVILELDADQTIKAMNQSASRTFGERNDGKKRKAWSKVLSPEGCVRLTDHLADAWNGLPQRYELKTRDAAGRFMEWDVRNIPIYVNGKIDGVFLIGTDITANKAVERALAASEALYRVIADNAKDLVSVADPDGMLRFVSPSYEKVLGYDPESLLWTSRFDYAFHEDREMAIRSFRNIVRNGTSEQIRYRCKHVDGTIVHIDYLGTPVYGEDGHVESVVLVGRDATEEVRCGLFMLESHQRYIQLQTSLDRFSSSLCGVVKVQELEQRLIGEVRDILQTDNVILVEEDLYGRKRIKNVDDVCNVNLNLCKLPDCASIGNARFCMCEIVETPDGYLLKLGEIRGEARYLYIGDKPDSLELEPTRIWLKTISRYVSMLYDNFRVMEDLTMEIERTAAHQTAPSWLLRLLFKINEHERRRVSQDLHDSALQEQIIWYRKLDQLLFDETLPQHVRSQLELIAQGLLDVMYQIRITCMDLRPPMLKEEGLVCALESLFEFTQMRSDYSILFSPDYFDAVLSEDQTIALYRIVQELLANATKHSNATEVVIALTNSVDFIALFYADNGVGMDMEKAQDAFASMGVYGMKERVHSLNGTIAFQSSSNEGLSIHIQIPLAAAGTIND